MLTKRILMASAARWGVVTRVIAGLVAAIIPLAGTDIFPTRSSAEEVRAAPAPVLDEPTGQARSEIAVLAGGCFWGVQGVYQHVEGVTAAVSGYAGGEPSTASYEMVERGTTGHAESVRIAFDPTRISYGRVLQIFFSVVHDPTQLNRQGPDSGPQYRSAIFPTTEEQARIAKAYIAQLDQAHVFPKSIVTTIEPGKAFYPAENYHQDFLTLHPSSPYIVINDLPKIDNLRRLFATIYRTEPVLVAAAKASN
jgi:peptide-methionine (S)-S-oxide reductase